MKKNRIAIVGGGLAGLTAAIHLAASGLEVILFEKEEYPHHKVCGEYLSREILPYLNSLGVHLESLKPVQINKLLYSTISGKEISTNLPLGGIGISRYALDNFLYRMALDKGVVIKHEEVTNIIFDGKTHLLTSEKREFRTNLVLGAYGKRSGLDKKLNRDFIQKKTGWLAIKAHYIMDSYPSHLVSLHNFKGGYCGLSKTESGAVNVCYLATYNSFKDHKDPDVFREKVLCQNPHLKNFFSKANNLFEKDFSIAQISFDKKNLVEEHILMLGDSAALIHPLCGNGMAMAIHSAKIASTAVLDYLEKKSSREKLEKSYTEEWNKSFRSRINTGRVLQKVLLNPTLAEVSQRTLQLFPAILPQIIKRTHGTTVV
ncbi:MAG TPA: NAD(P)/FAD-dependent oxidoreductase [Gillisia sp.]|nr:NAD(P)/FAD-dependent oxidoreductase [Gillisia sp.]